MYPALSHIATSAAIQPTQQQELTSFFTYLFPPLAVRVYNYTAIAQDVANDLAHYWCHTQYSPRVLHFRAFHYVKES